MSSQRADLACRIFPEPEIDHFDRLPDSLLLLVFNKIGDVKALGRCCVVSCHFHSLVPQVENVVVADGQGVKPLRVKPLSTSSASKRTLVPALNMRLWYAPHLELPTGVVLKGATLVAIRPSEQSPNTAKKEASDLSWVSTAFEEPYRTAATMLVKRRTYCLEMNSF
ncbi:F-box protein [Glycine soja]|uniref:F-box protein n=1 Tax=Glycine soja TaxID=3848 RepID=A0A0B2PH00_GLYSO|nr:F-box protein [Glycine soja]